jgi:hypothetical protein
MPPRATAPAVQQPVDPQLIATAIARVSGARRFQFTIDPNLPLKDLLPVPPSAKTPGGPASVRSLADVPEIDFQAPLTRELASEESLKRTAHTIAKVNHLNGKTTDGFLEALRSERPDLAGLPFAMGDDCRIKGDRSRQFTRAVATVRNALRQPNQAVQVEINQVLSTHFVQAVDAIAQSGPTAPPATMPAPSQPAPPATMPAPAQPTPPTTIVAQSAPMQATPPPAVRFTATGVVERAGPENFWDQYAAAYAAEDKQVAAADRAQLEHALLARIAALMQVLAPESPVLRLGLVKYLAAVSHAEATRALARLAVFSEEDEVRQAAVAALKVRRERDYTDILLASLRYPWPPVAQRGADALIKLERTDLVPQLVAVLDQPDPRAPVVKDAGGQRVQEVREMVRINHHRNCLLCHAPGNAGGVSPETLTAGVPVPSDPLPAQPDGYQTSSPDVLVRIDVTYLRQDFSRLQAVADAHPWPEMQRFDFLVRTRVLSEQEAAAQRQALTTSEPGRLSPYHRAALAALRELTGRDTAPTAEAWRKLLNLPADARPGTLVQ